MHVAVHAIYHVIRLVVAVAPHQVFCATLGGVARAMCHSLRELSLLTSGELRMRSSGRARVVSFSFCSELVKVIGGPKGKHLHVKLFVIEWMGVCVSLSDWARPKGTKLHVA